MKKFALFFSPVVFSGDTDNNTVLYKRLISSMKTFL